MQDLGFNKEGFDSAKEAFIKYLIKQSTGHDVQTPTEKRLVAENPKQVLNFPMQLAFDFDDSETAVNRKKA